MNHNILKKIIDGVALNEWRLKIKTVNRDYHTSFAYDYVLWAVKHCSKCKDVMFTNEFNYRCKSHYNLYSPIHSIKLFPYPICKNCNYRYPLSLNHW